MDKVLSVISTALRHRIVLCVGFPMLFLLALLFSLKPTFHLIFTPFAVVFWLAYIDGRLAMYRSTLRSHCDVSDDILGFLYSWSLFACLVAPFYAGLWCVMFTLPLGLVLTCLLCSWHSLRSGGPW